MNKTTQDVDWHQYAEKYDMLLDYNPFYQQLRKEILHRIAQWPIERDELILDVGAGTGNYSAALAALYPGARVLHIDNNTGMNQLARQKKASKQLDNLEILPLGIEEVKLESECAKGILSVHALYTFPDPPVALRKMYDWLQVGGIGMLVDPGRIVKVVNWQLAIGWHLITRHGLVKTLKIFKEAKPVSEQNRLIRQMQREGKLWTHTTDEFCKTIEAAGFQILDAGTCFRGLSDWAFITK